MKVCLISAAHLWVNPRLVKEADALHARGHEVVVMTVAKDAASDRRDLALLAAKPWKAFRLSLLKQGFGGRLRWFGYALRQKAFFALSKLLPGSPRIAAEAYYRGYPAVLARASSAAADFYVAHGQAALPIAAEAARRRGARFGFDCEDLNAIAFADGLSDPQIAKNIRCLERRFLKEASYVTVTSSPMAEALSEEYGLEDPVVVHNVFPLEEMRGLTPPAARTRRSPLSLVWISATIGPGRGLETALGAMRLLAKEVELHLFGRFVDPAFERRIRDLERNGLKGRVFFEPPPPPLEILRKISDFDVGLALEDLSCPNLSITVTNKFFIYLQAGLALAATDTPGQRSIFSRSPDIGFLTAPGDGRALARNLRAYIADPARLLAAKEASWREGHARYHWELARERFLGKFHEAVGERL